MDPSHYALVHGLRRTRGTLAAWQEHPWAILRAWLLGSLAAGALLLLAVWIIAELTFPQAGAKLAVHPPLFVGDRVDVLRIFGHNMLVLALHALACVAGFIAGSSLPLQAGQHSGLVRAVHERGRPIAIAFVIGATAFSLSLQAYVLGIGVAHVASALHTTPGLLLLGLLPHALPELVALFLPLAAWIVASRRGEWDTLLAATFVTVALAIPILVLTAVWEVYVSPHLLQAMLGYAA